MLNIFVSNPTKYQMLVWATEIHNPMSLDVVQLCYALQALALILQHEKHTPAICLHLPEIELACELSHILSPAVFVKFTQHAVQQL